MIEALCLGELEGHAHGLARHGRLDREQPGDQLLGKSGFQGHKESQFVGADFFEEGDDLERGRELCGDTVVHDHDLAYKSNGELPAGGETVIVCWVRKSLGLTQSLKLQSSMTTELMAEALAFYRALKGSTRPRTRSSLKMSRSSGLEAR